MLARWTGRRALPLPHPVLDWAAASARLLGVGAESVPFGGAALRYGFTLDTRRAERELDFRAADRIGLAREGDGSLRLETATSV